MAPAATSTVEPVTSAEFGQQASKLVDKGKTGALDELAVPNGGTSYPAKIIRNLMAEHGIPDSSALASQQQLQAGSATVPQWPLKSDGMGTFMSFLDFAPDNHDLLFGFMDDSLAPFDAPNQDAAHPTNRW